MRLIQTNLVRTACALALAFTAHAGTISFQGVFGSDDPVQLFNLTLSSTATVTMVSFAYGGGVNFVGTPIPSGGFDSFFTLFAADGSQIDTNDDGGCGNVNPGSGGCLDAWLSENLPAGAYTLALTQSGNDPIGSLGDGFTQQGQGNFTCPQGFCDTFGDQQNGAWAVDIRNVDSASEVGSLAAVPEPACFPMVAGSLILMALATRRQVLLPQKFNTQRMNSHEL